MKLEGIQGAGHRFPAHLSVPCIIRRFVGLQKSRSAPRGQYPDFFPEISRISTLITAVFLSVSSEYRCVPSAY